MKIADRRTGKGSKILWHAVSIIPGPHACAAATAIGLRRFLSRDAPRLPLVDCDCSERCQCKYRHHADRRVGPRRANDAGNTPKGRAPSPERRRPGERRARD